MMKNIFLLIFLFCFLTAGADERTRDSARWGRRIYNTKPWVEAPIVVGGFIANYFGIKKLKSKPGLDSATAVSLTPLDVPWFDRDAAVQDPAKAKRMMFYSDIALNTAIVLPLALLADKEIKSRALQIGLLFVVTEAFMANAYSWGVGHLNRKRPYVYNPQESIGRRTRRGSFNSFYGGHTAAASSCAFFIAKVYNDYYPDSKLRPWLFAAAIVPPATVAYFRHKAGMHFPSDNLAGMVGGAAIGILVPHFHKYRGKKNNVSLLPVSGPYNGFLLSLNF